MADYLADAYSDATGAVIDPTIAQVQNNWAILDLAGYSEEALTFFLSQTNPLVAQMVDSVATLTSVFLAKRMGRDAAQLDSDALRRPGVTLEQEYARPFVQARTVLAQGGSEEDARAAGLDRLDQLVETDAQRAKTVQAQRSLVAAGHTRYKRVTHSLKPCPLCLLASTKEYHISQLMPIHTRCRCSVDVINPATDLAYIDGKAYVGLRDIQIPEEYLTDKRPYKLSGRRENQAARVRAYMLDIEKGAERGWGRAYDDIVQLVDNDEVGPILTYRRHRTHDRPAALVPAQGKRVKVLPEQVHWDGPSVTTPWSYGDDMFESANQHWESALFDEYKDPMRRGARGLERDGYDERQQMDWTTEFRGAEYNLELEGKEIAARAVHADPTDDYLYRGMQMRPEDLDALATPGREVSLPLSSFIDEYGTANDFATGENFWTSSSVPSSAQPVVLKLAPGAKVAEVGSEQVGFGRFQVTNVTRFDPDDYDWSTPGHGAVRSTIVEVRQVSMLEAMPMAVADKAGAIPDYYVIPKADLRQRVYNTVVETGGVTIDLGGRKPTAGFVWAPSKKTELAIAKADFTPDMIDDYIDKHHRALKKPGNHLGLWTEGDTIYFDISRVGEPTAKTIEAAQKSRQLAVFDLKNFNTIDVGSIDDKGRYHRLGPPTDIFDKYRRQIEGPIERGSAASVSAVSGSRAGGRTAAAVLADQRGPTIVPGMGYADAHKAFSDRWPNVELYGLLSDSKTLPASSRPVASEWLRAFDEVLTEHPHVERDLPRLGIDKTQRPTSFAETLPALRIYSDKPVPATEHVAMSDYWVKHPAEFTERLKDDVKSGHFFPSTDKLPGYSTGIHEAGHVLDQYSGGLTSGNISRILQRAYIDDHPGVSPLDLRMPMKPISGPPPPLPDSLVDYMNWLGRNMSGYSVNRFDNVITPNGPEAVAEAFLDVRVNGEKAHDTSKAIYDRLMTAVAQRDSQIAGGAVA